MSNFSNQKMKLLYIMKIFLENTDEDSPISLAQIIEKLSFYNIKAERKSIYSDIALLKAFGIDIEMHKSKGVGYYVASRDFEIPELKLLLDAVQSSRFITVKKSRILSKKLLNLVSKNQAKSLKRQSFISDQPKTLNETIYYSVDRLNTAINQGKKVMFKYFDYNPQKQRVYRKNGATYETTPVSLCWNNDKYYLIAYSPKYDGYANYRIDRMSDVVVSNENADNYDKKHFNTAVRSKQSFGMYSGDIVKAHLRFDNSQVNVVLDKFGSDVHLINNGDTFDVYVEIQSSPVFLGWMFQFGDKAEIIAPESLRNDFLALSKSILNRYNSN
ncbi:MAG: transcriptional regulator [Christensenellaceae bacterium]|nr:transcriptional regulator [Christensenellaceae bacterium]